MATWTPDPTFYPSPRMAMQAPAEKLGYVAILNVARERPDALGVVARTSNSYEAPACQAAPRAGADRGLALLAPGRGPRALTRDDGMTSEIIHKLHNRIVELTANSATLRNQGAPGVVQAARTFLAELDPRWFNVEAPDRFEARLDAATETLRDRFPRGARNWGAARKALNLFLRDVLYNTYLAKAYRMARLRQWLEVPLDSYVARGLAADPAGRELPKWPGVKHLRPDGSVLYQRVAAAVARRQGIARVDLDLWYWRGDGS